jgi:hypothetical protein
MNFDLAERGSTYCITILCGKVCVFGLPFDRTPVLQWNESSIIERLNPDPTTVETITGYVLERRN